ncbi:hypothetical protein B0J18DRAFT_169168 [Chaetomium sp. MPI-SDFR-AT-0129]|nr:hypothetical protein B0J18DRAFT_169168 [Chaetomium sp. MPI-SDFR-AT-0129]
MEKPHHTFVAETGQGIQRRRKSRLACNPCRARKTGCDGRKPVCTACSLRGWDDKCSYPDSVMQQSAALTLVELDRRVQRLESGARADPGILRRPSPNVQSIGSGPQTPVPFGDDIKEEQEGQRHPMPDPFATHLPMSGTNATFMRDALEAVGQQRNSHDPTGTSESPVLSLESPTYPGFEGFSTLPVNQPFEEVDLNALTLPPYRVANDIFRWYWQNFHSIFPFLHWPTFEERCLATWKEKPPPVQSFEQVLFYATVNMVMAVACLRNETRPPDHRDSCSCGPCTCTLLAGRIGAGSCQGQRFGWPSGLASTSHPKENPVNSSGK